MHNNYKFGTIELKKDESVIVKKGEKGGANVLMDKQQCMDEAMKQLAEEAVYKKLENDPTNQFKKETWGRDYYSGGRNTQSPNILFHSIRI